jgi:Ca2+-binding RTX toxin-like protein
VGASLARNLIGWDEDGNYMPAQVQAYVKNSSIATQGDLSQTALANETIDAVVVAGSVAISGAGTTGVGLSGSGADGKNKIATQIKAFIEGDGSTGIVADSVTLTAQDTSKITADVVGGSLAGAFAGEVGVSLSIGVALAYNEIRNDIATFMKNGVSPVETLTGGITLYAGETATIKALSIAASASIAIAGTSGIALSGAGAETTNVILTGTNAYVEGSNLISAGDVVLYAGNTSTITAKIITGSVSAGIGGTAGVGASIGASLARNLIGWDTNGIYMPAQVQAYVRNSSIDAEGDLTQTAVADETIDAIVVAGSVAISGGTVGVGLSGSGADAENKISTLVKAFIEKETNYSGPTPIVADSVTLTALDISDIKADVGAGSLAASFAGTAAVSLSIGVALAENAINNVVQAYITNADSVTATDGAVTLQAIESATVDALSIAASLAASFGSVGVALSGAGAEATNTIGNSVNAVITDSSVTTSPSPFDYTTQHRPATIEQGDRVRLDDGDIYEYVSETGLSGPVDLSTLDYSDVTQWKRIANDIIVAAQSFSTITAMVGGVSAAVSGGSVAASGSIGVSTLENTVLNQIAAYIEDSTVSSADDITIGAKAMETVDAVSFSGSLAIAAGPGGALAGCGAEVTNTFMSGVQAYLQDTVAKAVDDIDVTAVSDSEVKKSQAIGVAVAGSLGAASVAASLVDNQISNTVQAYVISPYDYTLQDQPNEISQGDRIKLDSGDIYEYVDAAPLTGPVDLSTQNYADTTQWKQVTTSLEAGGDIAVSADVARARMSDVTATTASVTVGVVGLSGGGIDIENTITNNVGAFIGGPVNVEADGDVDVTASEDAYILGDATAVSVSASLGAGLGVALVENQIGSTIQAWVHEATITSENTRVLADSVADVAKTVSAGVSGSAILGAQGNEANAIINTLVKAYTADATLISSGDITISATANNTANTSAKGGAFGAIAVGAMIADVNLGRDYIDGQDVYHNVYEVEAAIDTGTTVNARTLRITASSTDDLLSDSTAGGGGAVAAAGAESKVTSNNATLARIGSGAHIEVNGLAMNSTHVQDVDASADSYAFAAAAGSGAGVDNTITSKANVDIGAGAFVTAKNIVINAKNQLTKDDFKDSSNLRSGSASLGNITVLLSETSIGTESSPFEAVVNIGAGANLTVEGDNQNPGTFKIEALNDVFAVDSVRIESVSGFGVSTGISRVEANTLAAINVNAATLESKAGDVYLTAKTDSSVNPSANLLVITALTGGAGAEATASTKAINAININNSTVKGADLYMYAGRDSSEVPNVLNSYANTELTAVSMFPNIAVPVPTADIDEINVVNILGASTIRALEDVNLVADEGIGGKDRVTAEGLALSLSLIPYGFPIPGYGGVDSTNSVIIDNQARIEAGINNQAVMLIKPVTLMGEQNIDPSRLDMPLADRILTDAEKLEEGISFVSVTNQDIINVVAGANKGGVVGNRYAYIGDPAELVLSEQDYTDTGKWTDVTAATTDADATYDSDFVTDVQYEYCELNVDEIAFNVSTGTVIQVAADSNGDPVAGAGDINALYRYTPQIDEPVGIVLHKENYNDETKWEKLVPAYDLNTPPPGPVNIEPGQIVRTTEDVLYEYLGASVANVDLSTENFGDIEKWGELAPTIYKSDVAVSFKASLENKFYVVKPTRLETPTMSLENVGSLLLAQRERILGWIANHGTNAEAIARYEIQLAVVEETLTELGLMDTFVDPDTGETAQVANEGLDVLFIELPDIYAAPGSIFIKADATLRDTFVPLVDNQLVARVGAKINVFNETPFSMTVNDTVIRDTRRVTVVDGEYTVLTPGNVYFNYKGLTAVQDPPDKRITITQDSISRNGADYDLDLELPEAVGQDIYVMGDVINEVGDVTIINNEGSINVSGEIRAEDVEIRAAQDFNLNTEDWFHNMDPRQYPGLDTYRQEVFNTAGTLTTATYADNPFIGAIDPWSSSILAQGNIAVTAQYLNINGLIQSGVQTVTLYVDESFAPTSTTSLLDDDGRPLEGISFGADRVPVDGYFDAQKQAIVVDEIIPKGGNIVLTGQILSTGNGMLKAAYGYTSVDIQNESPYHLILNRIDTTKKREGKITIIDTARLQKVEYVVDGTEVRETIYQGAPSDDGSGISRIVYEEVESLPHGLTDTIEYRPREGIQYMWTEGQEKTRVVLTKYEKKSFNLFGTDSDWMVKDSSYKWQVTNFRDEYPLLESEVLAAEPDYDLETLPSGTLVTLEAGQIVKDTQGNVYRYQGATATDFDLGTADYSDSSQWVPDIEVPSYADGEAYTIQYVMKNDTDVELVPNIDIVKVVADTNGVPFAKDGVVGHRYQYTAPDPAELVLRDQDYSDETKWTDVTNTTTDGQVTYLSSFENYTYKVQSWTTGGGWLRKKTVHTLTTQTFGEKDYYTHTLKADYPIEISFIQGPATPSINIDTKQDLLLQGTITTPEDGAITLTSGGDIIFGDTAAILGASPTISAGGSVRANVEGGKASNPTVAFGVMGAAGDPQVLSITSEHDIELRVVYDPDGNQSSTIVVGQIISTGGNVILHAGEGIQAFDSSSFIRGNQIELYTTEGAIGSADLPLLVDSDLLGSGGVAAKARGDIYIREIEGDLKLAQPQTWDDVEASIYSEEGDIYLHVDSGAILDAFYEEFRPRTQQEADELDAKQNLTGQKAREAAEESIRIEENDQTQLYHSYWETYRNAKPDEVAREIRIESVDAGNNELHFNQAHGLETGDQVFFSVGIDLSGEDYGDTSRWAEMVPNYDLGTVTGTVSLETDQIVKTADGVLYSYQGENASDVDLNNENYGDVSRWVKINPDYDLDKLAAGKRVMLETEQVVRTNDGLFYRYEGESVSKPQSNLENDLAYYVVVKDDTTIQLALSRYDAAISETPKVVDVRIEGDEDFNYASLLEYGYSYGDLQQDVSTLEERYQKIHETYGDGEYDPNFLYQISGQERQARIEARMFSPGALRYPVSRSLFSILYPDADGAQVQGPDTSEMPNIIGRNITLTGGAESAVGRMTGEVTVDLRNGYESLADEQKEILSIATVEDIVGISYGLYRYQGTTADLDLKDQDFNDGTLWQKLTPDFTTSTVTSPVQIANGQTVLVQSGAAYGLYRYEGTASAINLAKQVYADGDLWQRVTADFVTSDGEVLVAQGQLVENKGEIDTMTLAVWNDVDLVEPDRVSVSIGQGVALETAGDFKIDHIEAGGDVRIKAGGAITDLDAGGTAAIISGDLILVAENETAGNIGTLDNPVTLGLHEGATLTARAAQDIFISAVANLYLDTVQTENHVHLVAQDSIFDGIGDDVWNIRGGSISLRAVTGGIGSIDNDLDFDSQNSPSWTLDATAEQDIYLAVANGGFVIGDNIQVTSNTGDASMTVTDSKGPGDNLIVSSTKTDAILSIAGSVILRAGDNITVETGSTIGAAISVIIYGDYGNADPGTGSVMNFLSPIPSVPINVYGYSDDDLVTLTGVTYTGADPAPVWTIDGLDGSDQYLVNLTGMGKSEVKVLDTGAIGDDTLTINGTSAADTFLFRKDFVALLRPDGRDAQGKPKYHSDFERVWYDENINNQLIVNSGEGDDYFALDDNSAATTINTGAGKDRVQIGQMFKSGPTGVETVETTFGFLSNGVSVVTTINAGDGDDDISVYRNRAELYLNGEQGDDKFDVRAFAKETTTITGGDGADTIKYVVNAPVNINGGEGEDLLILIGTEFADDIAVTDKGVFGAGLTSDYNNVENLIVDAYIGDDKIFVLSTNPGVNTVLLGNYGSDTIYVGGVPIGIDLDDIIVTAEDVGFIVTNTLDLIAGPLRLEGGSGEGEGARPLGDPVQMPGEGEDDPSFGGDELIEQLDESLSHDTLNVYNTNSETDDEGWLDSTTLTGLNMSDGVTIAGREYPGGFVYHDMEEMNITLGSGSDIFNVRATHSGTTSLTTSGGSDTIHVSNLAPDIGGVVDQIAGLLTIDGGDNDDIINIDDTGDTDDNAGVLTNTRLTGLDMGQGIQYTHIEELNIDLGSGDDVFNIRGTSVTTNLDLHDGNDRIYVSSKADLDIHSSTDFLEGDLDNILGQLNIDAGQGKHLLMVSDSDSHEGDTDILITNALIHGLAPADISYKTDPVHGNFAGGITLWSGYGQDNFTVASTHKREGVRTITTLNTGLGDDSGTVSLEAGTDGFLVLNLQGPDNAVDLQTDNDSVDASLSSLPLIIFGGTGDDTIFGGSGDDLIFGDRGRVHYLNENAEVVAVLGGGGPGDTTDGIIREPGTAFSVDGFVGGNDTIDAGEGDNIVSGGFGDDGITTGDGNDVVMGDNGHIDYDTDGAVKFMATIDTDPSTGGDDGISVGSGINHIFGGMGNDQITTGDGTDIILGDNGLIAYEGITGNLKLKQISSTEASEGGNDTITTGNGDKIILGGFGDDTITSVTGNDIVIGDNGVIEFDSEGRPQKIMTANPEAGGSDVMDGGAGDDIMIGGPKGDKITGGSGDDILIGDGGMVTLRDGVLRAAETIDPFTGGNDFIDGGPDHDILIGGFGSDLFVGNFTDDIIVGEYARVTIEDGKVVSVVRLGQYSLDIIASTLFSLYASPFVLGWQEAGPATVGGILPGKGAGIQIMAPEAGAGGAGVSSLTSHHDSFAKEGYSRPEGYGEPEGYTVTEKAEEYTVKKGDTLWDIAEEKLGNPLLWPDIWHLNPEITNPDVIYPGQVIKVPIEKRGPDYRPESGELGDEKAQVTVEKEIKKDNEFGRNRTRMDSELGIVVAGLMGWGVASIRRPGDPSILDREAFRKLTREADNRRFLRWHDGQFREAGSWGRARIDEGDLPSSGILSLSFDDRRKCQ